MKVLCVCWPSIPRWQFELNRPHPTFICAWSLCLVCCYAGPKELAQYRKSDDSFKLIGLLASFLRSGGQADAKVLAASADVSADAITAAKAKLRRVQLLSSRPTAGTRRLAWNLSHWPQNKAS